MPPDILEFQQREDIERGRIVVATLLASIALASAYTVFALVTEFLPAELTAVLWRVAGGLAIAYTLTLFIFYRTAAFTGAGHCYCGFTFIIYVLHLPWLPAGLLEVFLAPMLAIPLFGAAIGGIRVGMPWLIVIAATPPTVAGYWIQVLGQPSHISHFFLGVWLMLSTSIAFVTWAFEHVASHMRYRLDEECARFAFDAAHDPLTGLANRAVFARRLDEAIEHARFNREVLALLYIDLNDFKPINDQYGHHVGDAVLVAVGQRLAGAVRQSDTVARIGGDEFVVLCRHLQRDSDIHLCVNRVNNAMAAAIAVEDHLLRVTASIGVVGFPHDGDTADALQQRADALMYESKQRRDRPDSSSFTKERTP